MASPYKINIPLFEGPLDLLLVLINKQEMNIHDIQSSKITPLLNISTTSTSFEVQNIGRSPPNSSTLWPPRSSTSNPKCSSRPTR